ncbi:hypothetical protein [uncultured Microbacterium sp.]|uniref:hypothetical protein n=1 Tax=uncultured Microbacterium sp. TaxID=191216 RepID=UPI00262E9789|nr:hypothetical protein [uncultured Microbacterium sp.]
MVCVVAFLVVLVLSAVSAKYRALLGRAWGCVWRKVTFRPCDTTFREDVKSSLLAPLAIRHPRWVKPASVAIEIVAWLMVLSLIVSLYLLGRSGLNLFVYGTCDKQDTQACALAAESCSIDGGTPTFGDSLARGDVLGAFGNEFSSLGETITAVPSRMKTWDAADFAPENATYLGGYRPGLPVAVEVLDPGCRFCAELFRNMAESGFAETHNLTYLAYPISSSLGSKFPNSPLVASYLAAVQSYEADLGHLTGPTGDWAILEQLFTGDAPDGTSWQEWMNDADPDAARVQLQAWLAEAGYDAAAIAAIDALAGSDAVAGVLAHTRTVVESDIRTVAIPTLIAGGGLHTGLVGVDTLSRLP